MKAIAYGPQAFLLRFADKPGKVALARCLALVKELENDRPAGVVELTPGFTTLLVEFDPKEVPDRERLVGELLARLETVAVAELPQRPVIEVPVVYDGEDLERVARLQNLSPLEVIELHCTPVYLVYLIGFSPGFPYLGDLDSRLHTPRLREPRPRVRAGSIAIGGEHTGIYSVDTPGGWNIIGHTPLKIFDPSRGAAEGADESMFLLRPGDRVKFLPQD